MSTVEANSLWQSFVFLLCHSVCSSNKCLQATGVFVVSQQWHSSPQAPVMWAIPPHIDVNGQCGICLRGASFPKPISSFSWLAHQLLLHRPCLEFLRSSEKLAPVCKWQGKTEERLITPDLEMAVFINKGIYFLSLPWVVLTGFSHLPTLNGFNAIFLFQSCILEAVPNIEECKQNVHSNDRREDEELPIARV